MQLARKIGGGSYSTTEKFTGDYWIDGKPIYTRVVIVNNPVNTWDTFQSYGVTGIGHIIDIKKRFKVGTWWTNDFNYQNTDQLDATCQDTGFRLYCSSGVGTVTQIEFIIEYTKS